MVFVSAHLRNLHLCSKLSQQKISNIKKIKNVSFKIVCQNILQKHIICQCVRQKMLLAIERQDVMCVSVKKNIKCISDCNAGILDYWEDWKF